MRVLVTGASGFVGSRLLSYLASHTSWELRSASRLETRGSSVTSTSFVYGDLATNQDWQAGVAGIDTVIHLAARVHAMSDVAADSLDLYRRINVTATERLARDAASAGVRRFVFVSSVKVNGECTRVDMPFSPDDTPRPQDAYGTSKLEAEIALRNIAASSAMEVVIVRPCLVYGPGVGANFLMLMRWLCKGVPLPLGAIQNSRSLLAIDNLCSLLVSCAVHPGATGQVFLASDGEDISTTDLIRRLGAALGARLRLMPVPERMVRATLALVGRADIGRRLCDSLRVDGSAAQRLLGWHPAVTLEQGLQRTADAYLSVGAEGQR